MVLYAPAVPSRFNRAGLAADLPPASPALEGVTWTYSDVGSATYTGRVDRCNGAAWAMIVPPSGTNAAVASPATISGRWDFTTFPEAHAASSDATPYNARTPTDSITVGLWNLTHNGITGDLLHFTTGTATKAARTVADGVTTSGSPTVTSATAALVTGSVGGDQGIPVSGAGIPANSYIGVINSPNSFGLSSSPTANVPVNATVTASGVSVTIGAGNPNGCIIAIGVDNGATGIVIRNKSEGIGLNLQQKSTVYSASSYALFGVHESSVAPWAHLELVSTAGTVPMIDMIAKSLLAPTGALHMRFGDNGIGGSSVAGTIHADDGVLDWHRTVQSVALNTSQVPMIRTADSLTNPSETYTVADSTGSTEVGQRMYVHAFSGANMWAHRVIATADRLKLQVATASAAKGSETFTTAIEMKAGGSVFMGFFGAAVVGRQVIGAAATDAATTQTLVNNIATALNNLGLTKVA